MKDTMMICVGVKNCPEDKCVHYKPHAKRDSCDKDYEGDSCRGLFCQPVKTEFENEALAAQILRDWQAEQKSQILPEHVLLSIIEFAYARGVKDARQNT